ncbi:MAG: radical SAM family heme chaperone HemW [Nitrospirota bacterium]
MALRQDGIGLYLHIPFCERRCRFCAFVTRDYRDDRAVAFVADLLKEIELAGDAGLVRGRRVGTVYFGGGTPTTLSPQQLLAVLDACRRRVDVAPDAEITIEANPTGVDGPALLALRDGGITRVSFGAQSFDDAELDAAGTPHRADDIARAVRSAREAGLPTVNLDLIYGFPGQTPARWLANLDAAIALEPDHLSFYGLTIEEGTPLHRDMERGRMTLPDGDAMADLYEMGRERLNAAGYVQYEVSNFARPGHECRHNLGYWTDREWLGLGPSAHSYLDGDRFSNVESLSEYHRLVEGGLAPIAEREKGTPELRAREAVAFGLRTVVGVRLAALKNRYHLDPVARVKEPIARLIREGWLVLDDHVLRPSATGLAMADELAVALL